MKVARIIFLVCAAVAMVLVAMVAAFYGIEDWRGAHAWAVCRQDLEARGERLDAAAFIPPMVPDEENLAMAPLFVRMYEYRVNPVTRLLTFAPGASNSLRDEVNAMPRGAEQHGVAAPHSAGDWSAGRPFDLAAWQQYYRKRPGFPHAAEPQSPAEDVLLALTKYDPILDEVAQAANTRPRTRFPVNWTDPMPARIALPHYNSLQCMTSVLRMRTLANLNLGRHAAAMRDLALARRFIGIAADDPLIIAQLVSVTETGIIMQPIWEGLKARQWTALELEQIKEGLRGLDYLAGYQQAMRGERATTTIETADYFKAHGGAVPAIRLMQTLQDEHDPHGFRFFDTFVDLMPGGWYDQNKAVGCRFCQDGQIDAIDVQAHRVWVAKARASEVAGRQMAVTPYTWLLKIAAPVYASVITKMAAYQADVDHAVTACALEQFYLDRHAYPARLDALVPTYLDRVPPDVIDGAPTRYRLTPEGRYVLYSVGWNGRDDGGQLAWQKEGTRRDNNQGDWVWQYQPLQPPANIQRSK